MTPTRVLLVSWEYPPVIAGGLGRHVHRLSEALVRRGADVRVLTRGVGTEGDAGPRKLHGVVVHRVPEPDFPREDMDAFIAWVGRMNADMAAAALGMGGGFDLVHSHDWLVARAAREAARRWDVPWLVTVHATEHGRHQGRVGRHPQSWIHAREREMARDADALIACSSYMRAHVAEAFGVAADSVTVVPNGTDAADLRPAADAAAVRARFARPHERLVLLAGRLVYEKGFHCALDALPGVIERVGGVRFVVAGWGPAARELEQRAAALGLTGRGTFAGWVGDEVLASLYRVADVCVVPSLYEPFGLVALEAMAAGCPCVVADTGGLRELVAGNPPPGLSFPPGDADALGRAAERLLTDGELRRRVVAAARERAREYDWDDAARRTATVYDELTGGGAGRSAPGAVRTAPARTGPSATA